jgi:serine/threonine protein kinase
MRIGRYQLIGRLAKGGMAEAYLALSGDLPGLRTLVVVKRILPHLSENPQFVRMFFDEARIGVLLDHPNIARLIEVGYDGGGYFLAMEPVQGKPLSAILRRSLRRERPISHPHAAYIVGQVANGLGYAHALTDASGRPLNVVHRDVSPENILVSFEGAVKVIDFGIASALGRLTETIVGGLKGKVEYRSPEQASGGAIDRRSDVFALGIVLWEALSGRRLFRRGTDLATMRAILDQPIPRPSGAMRISPRLERIVMTALEKDPDDRFQDAHEMSVLLLRHAFNSDGFDPTELVAHVKQLFPSDYAGWRATTRAALETEDSGPRKVTATFPLVRAPDERTGEPTLSLHKREMATPPPPVRTPPQLPSWGVGHDPGSDGGEPNSTAGSGAGGAAAYAGAGAWQRRIPAFVWVLIGVLGAVGLFLVVRPKLFATAAVPAKLVPLPTLALPPSSSPSPLVEPLQSARPAVEPPAPVFAPTLEPPTPGALPALSPPVPTPPAAARPTRAAAPRWPARVVKPAVRKRAAVAKRTPAAAVAKPAAPAPSLAPAPPTTPAPPAKPAPPGKKSWNDPFN